MRYLLLVTVLMTIGASADAGFLSSTRSAPPTPPPMFTGGGQTFLANGNNSFMVNGNNGFSQ